MTKPDCLYNLYSLDTKNCIFNCPDNSCICVSIPFSCSCKPGYKLVPGSTYACIPEHWSGYIVNDYKYTIKCDEGYTTGCNGECCACAEGYVPKKLDPLKCAFDTFRCIEYTEGDNLFICTSCEIGYAPGCGGKCCLCDNGYVMVVENPIECAPEIENCKEHMIIDGYLKCKECDDEYIMLAENPGICILRIEHCQVYKYYDTFWVCGTCELGYKVDTDLKCNECQSGYLNSNNDPFTCHLEIANCEYYETSDNSYTCIQCKLGYSVNGIQNCECDLENFYLEGGSCIEKSFEVGVYSEYNSIIIEFSKPLNKPLTLGDFEIAIAQEIDERLLRFELIVIKEYQKYSIAFFLEINGKLSLNVSITIFDTVYDRNMHSLNSIVYYDIIELVQTEVENSSICGFLCKECGILNYKLSCIECGDYAFEKYDGCECFTPNDQSSSETCKPICPENMSIDLNLKTCIPIQPGFDTSNTQHSNVTHRVEIYTEYLNDVSTSSIALSLTVGLVFCADRAWSFMAAIQIFTYLPLYQVDMPSYLINALKSQDKLTDYFNHLTEDLDEASKPFDKAVDFKYATTNLVKNAIKPIFILVGIITLNALIYIISRISKGRLKHYSEKAIKLFYLNIYLRYLTQMYLDLIIPCFIHLLYVISI